MATKCFLLILLPILSLFLLTTTISARPGIHFHPCNTLIISIETRNLDPNPNHNLNPNFLFPTLRPLHLHRLRNPRLIHRRFRNQITNLPLHHKTELSHPNEITDLPLGFKDHIINGFFYDKTQVFRPIEITDFPLKDRRLSHPSEMTDLPFGLGSFRFQDKEQFRPTEMTDLPFGFSSFRDRTKDILSVVASLLFGAACGALTAGTMYLVWSIVNYRHGDGNYRSFDGFSSDDEDDDDNDDLFNPKKTHYVAIPAAPVKEKDSGDVTAVVDSKETV